MNVKVKTSQIQMYLINISQEKSVDIYLPKYRIHSITNSNHNRIICKTQLTQIQKYLTDVSQYSLLYICLN